MRRRFMRALGVLNVLLAIGLVAVAMWLYGREHDVRRLERQIRKLEQARQLEEDAIRRLRIEWQSLRNPLRLERLARARLPLAPPAPTAVRPFMTLLEDLPMRPEPATDAAAERDALAAMALRAAGEEARSAPPGAADEGAAAEGAAPEADPLTDLVRETTPEAGR